MKVFKVLGKRRRIPIPYEIRRRVGFDCNDILSFEEAEGGRAVVIRRGGGVWGGGGGPGTGW